MGKRKERGGGAELVAKKAKKEAAEPEFSNLRFKFLLRSPETIITALQTFVDICEDTNNEEDDMEGIRLIDAYIKSSPQCSEVMDLLTPKSSSKEVSLVFTWMRVVLEKCHRVMEDTTEFMQSVVKVLLTKHQHLVLNSLRQGSKNAHVKATLSLLLTVVGQGGRFARLLHSHLDLNNANWPGLLSQRNRKDEIDIRTYVTAILQKLLQVEDGDVTKSVVEQKVLLQQVMLGLKYDRSEYVERILKTVHQRVVLNRQLGKNAKMYLFSTPVIKELLTLYQWPGPGQWGRQPTEEEKLEYSEDQQKVAKLIHALLVDLLANHKLGICFKDISLGMSNTNKNPAVRKVLQTMVTCYRCPLSQQLVLAILKACPDQTSAFLSLLQSHLVPRPVDMWIACLQFFLEIVENMQWPSELSEDIDVTTVHGANQLVDVLFPPMPIITLLSNGLKDKCATVRHLCMEALKAIAVRGRHFHSMSKRTLGDQACLTQAIDAFIRRMLPNGKLLSAMLQKCSSKDNFAMPISRQLYKDTDLPMPYVSRFEHVVAIVRMYSLMPYELAVDPVNTMTILCSLLAEMGASGDKDDCPSEGMPASLPSFYLLHALSLCNAKTLHLFTQHDSGTDVRQTMIYWLVCLMQTQTGSDHHRHTTCLYIVKLLVGTGMFSGQERELEIWLTHLRDASSQTEEVITFFVGLLCQHASDTFIASDRLLQLEEESAQLYDGSHTPSAMPDFSPLVVLALDGDFHKDKEVQRYVSRVLVDILHSVHDHIRFTQLVHSLATNLDSEVTLYLTLHSAGEKFSLKSIRKRLEKKVRLREIRSLEHQGLELITTLAAGKGTVNEMVGSLPPSHCLPLVEQCLHYIGDLVMVTNKTTQGKLVDENVAMLCVQVVRATCLHLLKWAHNKQPEETGANDVQMETDSDSDTNDCEQSDSSDCQKPGQRGMKRKRKQSVKQASTVVDNSDSEVDDDDVENDVDENDDDERGSAVGVNGVDKTLAVPNRYCAALKTDLVTGASSVAELSALRTDLFQMLMKYVLSHRLISSWLFAEGFQQSGTPMEWVVRELYDILQTLAERHQSALTLDPVIDVPTTCWQLMQAATGSGPGDNRPVPQDIQPLLCRGVDALLAIGGQRQQSEGLLVLLSVAAESFTLEGSQTPSPLGDSVCRAADCAKPDSQLLKDLQCHPQWSSALVGMFETVSTVNSRQLEWLAVRCLQCVPDLATTCPSAAFCRLLQRLTAQPSPSIESLVLSVMSHSAQCRAACGAWLNKKRKKSLKQKTQEFSPLMLMYLRLMLDREDTASDDVGVQAVCEALCADLTSQPLDIDHIDPAHLRIICHLISCDKIELPLLQKLQKKILSLLQEEANLHEAHVQLLAAIVRQQSVHACALGQEEPTTGKKWTDYEQNGGKVLVACLTYLTGTQGKGATEEPIKLASSRRLLHLCRQLLFLGMQPTVRASVVALLPAVVTCCLKYHYKDALYISLLRQLIQKAFTEEEKLEQEDIDEDGDLNVKQDSDDDEVDMSDDDVDEDNSKNPQAKSHPAVLSSTKRNLKDAQFIVSGFCKRLGVVQTGDVATKCVKLFGEELESTHGAVTLRSQIVNRWTGAGATHKSFFLWPRQDHIHPRVQCAEVSKEVGTLMVEVCEKVVGHTAFLSVLQEGAVHEKVRGELIGLLACLVRLHPACCLALPQTALVAAYHASLSLTDQNLLYLILASDLNGKEKLRPGLWGPKAVHTLEVKKQMGRSLLTETTLQNVLELLDPDTMADSILHFPLMRTMDFQQSEFAMQADRMMSKDDCYDPRFLLTTFFHFIGPECVVDVRSFVSNNGLGFTLAALSSHDESMRRLAIGILANLSSHLQANCQWSGAPLLLNMLEVLIRGMTKECQKVSSIVTLFLAKAANIILRPESEMHYAINSFLVLRPALDINNVPEFFKLFKSQKQMEVVWILGVLQGGLRERGDHHLFARRSVYQLLKRRAGSCHASQLIKKECLKVWLKASSIATVAEDLVTDQKQLTWLSSFIRESLVDTSEMVGLVCQQLHNLVFTPEFNRQRLWWFALPLYQREYYLRLSLLPCLQYLLQGFSQLDLQSLEMLVDCVQHPHITPSPNTLLPVLAAITWHVGRLIDDKELRTTAAAITTCPSQPDRSRDKDSSTSQKLRAGSNAPRQKHSGSKNVPHQEHSGDKDNARQEDSEVLSQVKLVQMQRRMLQLLCLCERQQQPCLMPEPASVAALVKVWTNLKLV